MLKQMTVADLMDRLKRLPDDLPVWVSSDPEGNGVNPLADVEATTRRVILWPMDQQARRA